MDNTAEVQVECEVETVKLSLILTAKASVAPPVVHPFPPTPIETLSNLHKTTSGDVSLVSFYLFTSFSFHFLDY